MKETAAKNDKKHVKFKEQNIDQERREMLKLLGYAAPATILLLTADRVAAQSEPEPPPPRPPQESPGVFG